jgi:phosphohistidine phosphatase SixA
MQKAANSTPARATELVRLATRRAFFLGALCAPLGATIAHAQATPAQLVAAMREGGKVVFLRHARTVAEQVDTGRLGDRAGQRNLSPQGIEQARALGRAFKDLDIRFGRIIVSPVFRARDTAELAFGAGNFTESMEVVADEYAGGQVNFMVESTRRLLRTPPPSGANLLIVGHRTPLEMVTRQQFPDTVLPEGAMAVFAPTDSEGRLLGTLEAEELAAVALLR